MNWDQVEGKWKQYKGKVKEKWGKLTDDDIDVISGKRQQLVGKIQGALRACEGRRRETSRRVREEVCRRKAKRKPREQGREEARGRGKRNSGRAEGKSNNDIRDEAPRSCRGAFSILMWKNRAKRVRTRSRDETNVLGTPCKIRVRRVRPEILSIGLPPLTLSGAGRFQPGPSPHSCSHKANGCTV